MKTSTFAQLKASARKSLLGHYSTVIAALLLTQIIIFLINMPFSRMIQEGMNFLVTSRVLFGSVGSFFVSLLSVLMGAGLTRIHMLIARGQNPKLSEVLYPFKNRPDKYIGFGILIFVVSFVTILPGSIVLGVATALSAADSSMTILLMVISILLLIAGITVDLVILLSWALTIYILLDDSDMRVMNAIQLSKDYMKGNKWRMFRLYLSFIGWFLLGMLSFFIGWLWIIPYMSQTLVWFYLDFLPDKEDREPASSQETAHYYTSM